MSTNSLIGIMKDDNGPIAAAYCHWDGGMWHVGKTLLEHYSDDVEKVLDLVALGAFSSLYSTPDKTYSCPKNTFIGGTDTPTIYNNFYDYTKDRGSIEFFYVYNAKIESWFVAEIKYDDQLRSVGAFKPLENAVAKFAETEYDL